MVCGKEEGEAKIGVNFPRGFTLVYVHKQLSAVLRMNGKMSEHFFWFRAHGFLEF